MRAFSYLRYAYLGYCSQPRSDRAIYQAIFRHGCQRILEVGIGRGERALRMLEIAAMRHSKTDLRYVGIDLFEGRPTAGSGMTLKDAHRRFKAEGLSAQLLPGDPYSALMRAANALRDIDLVVVAADQDAASLERAWFYLPRVLHAQSCVFVETTSANGSALTRLERAEVDALAARKPQRKSA